MNKLKKDNLNYIYKLLESNKYEAALIEAEKMLEKSPSSYLLLNFKGLACIYLNNLSVAEDTYIKAISINNNFFDAHYNLGHVHELKGNINKAIESYIKALSIDSKNIDATLKLSNLYIKKQQFDNAYQILLAQCEDNSQDYRLFQNIANVLFHLSNNNLALDAINWALILSPKSPELHNTKGLIFQSLQKNAEALKSYHESLEYDPRNIEALNNIGAVYKNTGNLKEAISWFDKAITLNKKHANSITNKAECLLGIGENIDDAMDILVDSIDIDSNNSRTYTLLGDAKTIKGENYDALACYQKALEIDFKNRYSLAKLMHTARKICYWDLNIQLDSNSLSYTNEIYTSETPFSFLSLEDAPEKQLLRSQHWSSVITKNIKTRDLSKRSNDRIKLAYFSADFHDFPGMHLMIGMLEKHDRSKFEIYAFSYGPNINDPMRNRIVNAVDHFIDIKELSTEAVVELCDKENIDIAIHRNGFTAKSRSSYFARRVAPVQINYLGYPGSLGSTFIDYIIADKTVIPENQKSNYSEEILYLPDCYQPNDNMRDVAITKTTRNDFGLPEDSFVFCCFNNSYKISPEEFDIWMRVLLQVPNSVLWLYKSNVEMVRNLGKEAVKRGVNANRLVFADRLPQSEHLARHKHADLFLDTFNYNAHTTASDALWTGLPVVTKIGQQFAARVSASLLNAIGASELITESEEEYEALIIKLASQPEKLKAIKEKIHSNRLSHPLFDTEKYTRDFENLLHHCYGK